MVFKTGESGNPGGRAKHLLPDGRSLKQVATEYTLEAIETLVEVMRCKTEVGATRTSAANSLLDRAFGRPSQAIVGGDDDDAPVKFINVIELIAGVGANSPD